MNYRLKYLSWKQKYLNLKILLNLSNEYPEQFGGDSNPFLIQFFPKNNENKANSSSDSDNAENPERQKTDPGRGVVGDAMYYWIANTSIDKSKDKMQKNKWTYVEPETQNIKPDPVPYTEFNQENLQILYPHIRSEYDEGFDIGYIVGYECGCNQDKNPEKKMPPGNISNNNFLSGFYDGFDLAFYKGTKYYYSTWMQINNNNVYYKKALVDHVSNGESEKKRINRSDPNYDPIEEQQFNEYYIYLKKKLVGKKHWFV